LVYPTLQSLTVKLVPADQLQQGNAISRLAQNAATMAGSAVAGVLVAGIGPGWTLGVDGLLLLCTAPVMLLIRSTAGQRENAPGMLRELREGWSEFRSHTWLWATTLQYSLILMCWFGAVSTLGPPVAKAHLGGPAAWGAITAAEAAGWMCGGVLALRYSPKRPIRFVVVVGALIALPSLSLAMLWPLAVMCALSFVMGFALEVMMVQWTTTLGRFVAPDKLARVNAYDVLGSLATMPLGALIAGPLGVAVGVRQVQFGAAVLTVAATLAALTSRQVRALRWTDAPTPPPDAPSDVVVASGAAEADGTAPANGFESDAAPEVDGDALDSRSAHAATT
jgi:predicted MFS family arabinose efflux permease